MGVRNAVGKSVALFVLGAVMAPAWGAASAPQFGVHVGAERIIYKEERAASAATRKDTGQNFAIGVSYDNLLTSDGDTFHSIDAEY